MSSTAVLCSRRPRYRCGAAAPKCAESSEGDAAMTVSRLRDIPGIGVDAVGNAADAAADPEILRLENLDTDLRHSTRLAPTRHPPSRGKSGPLRRTASQRSPAPRHAPQPGHVVDHVQPRIISGQPLGIRSSRARFWPRLRTPHNYPFLDLGYWPAYRGV